MLFNGLNAARFVSKADAVGSERSTQARNTPESVKSNLI